MSEVIRERLKKLMDENRYTKAEISEKLGIGYSTLWRRLNGERGININFLSELAKLLNTSVSYLIGETDNPKRGENSLMQQEQLPNQISHKEPINYSYWGGVVDEAHKVAEYANITDIESIESLLKLAYNTLVSTRKKLENTSSPTNNTEGAIIAQMPVYGGHHNSNKLTVETA